jgi:hypothetical protein
MEGGIVTYLVGLDIGQRSDRTALAVVEETADELMLVALERVQHKPYPEVAQLVADTMAALTEAALLVDCTGVGRPVTDQLVALGVRLTRINIHGGSAVTRLDDGTLSVPKRDLISSLVVAFESKRLRIAAGLPHADTLEREAAAFQMKLSASGHDSYNAREGEHDDLVLAVSLPVWHVGRRPPPAASASVDPAPDTYRAERHTLMAGLGRRRLI